MMVARVATRACAEVRRSGGCCGCGRVRNQLLDRNGAVVVQIGLGGTAVQVLNLVALQKVVLVLVLLLHEAFGPGLRLRQFGRCIWFRVARSAGAGGRLRIAGLVIVVLVFV